MQHGYLVRSHTRFRLLATTGELRTAPFIKNWHPLAVVVLPASAHAQLAALTADLNENSRTLLTLFRALRSNLVGVVRRTLGPIARKQL